MNIKRVLFVVILIMLSLSGCFLHKHEYGVGIKKEIEEPPGTFIMPKIGESVSGQCVGENIAPESSLPLFERTESTTTDVSGKHRVIRHTVTTRYMVKPIESTVNDGPNNDLSVYLKDGNIAFNYPPEMNIQDTVQIQLKISMGKTLNELKDVLTKPGIREGDSIKVASAVEAQLTGSDFTIERITPAVQVVMKDSVTEWLWEIKPKNTGKHKICLTVTALLGESKQWHVKTFEKELTIRISIFQKLSNWSKAHWEYLISSIILPLFIVWLTYRLNRKKKKYR